MDFTECSNRLKELYYEIQKNHYSEREVYEKLDIEFNEVFLNTIKASISEKIYFSASPLNLFIVELEKSLEINQKEEIDFNEIEYLKNGYLFINKIISSDRYSSQNNDYFYKPMLNRENLNLLNSILKKRSDYLETLLYKKGIEVIVTYPNGDGSIVNRTFKKHINIMVENENLQPKKSTIKTKPNKSLLFDGKELNLSERFKIANKVLDIDRKLRTLNIPELEKYQLLAYILGCDKDNARNIMNGSYNSKDRDFSKYFEDLGLNK